MHKSPETKNNLLYVGHNIAIEIRQKTKNTVLKKITNFVTEFA